MLRFSMSSLLLIVMYFGMQGAAMAQSNEPFCGKKWICEMTKDGDGNTHPPEEGTEKDYMIFSCDSTFTLEERGTNLKGHWLFNEETATITLTQTQLTTIPDKISFHFMEYDEAHLVIIGQGGTNSQTTVYFTAK